MKIASVKLKQNLYDKVNKNLKKRESRVSLHFRKVIGSELSLRHRLRQRPEYCCSLDLPERERTLAGLDRSLRWTRQEFRHLQTSPPLFGQRAFLLPYTSFVHCIGSSQQNPERRKWPSVLLPKPHWPHPKVLQPDKYGNGPYWERNLG